MSTDLESWAHDLIQDVLATAEADGTTTHDAFTQRVLGHLTEAGEIDDGLVCYFRAHAVEISGYGLTGETGKLDLFTTYFRQDTVAPSLPANTLDTLVRRAETFAVKSANPAYLSSIDDSNPAYDMVEAIQHALPEATAIRLFVLTNSTTRRRMVTVEPIAGVQVTVQVWDLHRLHRLLTSGVLHEPITVDFQRRFGAPLPALTAGQDTTDEYSVLMAIIPGQVLADLYGEYGTRLLELNVRGYLQSRGAVNKGIRQTILNNPERFLAYNNGISATASRCLLVDTSAGPAITELADLQIVNGGQTTASIYHAARRDRADLSRLFVPAKITVLPAERIQDVVPKISMYSNTQNKVTTADFSSNDSYHVEIEKLSRSIWAPAPDRGGQETHWFYERARGQYSTELARFNTPAQQRAWKVANPTKQKFTKTDLAKFVNSYECHPHVVSLGAEKNFREFMIRVNGRTRPVVDQVYFERLIAMAILFRETERIVTRHAFGGYRANIVTYSVAKLAHSTDGAIPLEAIWRMQGLPEPVDRALDEISPLVNDLITGSAAGANVTEWCKRPEAWVRVAAMPWSVPEDLNDHATVASSDDGHQDDRIDIGFDQVPSQIWLELSQWAKENNRLDPWQRSLARSLSQLAGSGRKPLTRQMAQGMAALAQARRQGFIE